MNTELVAASPRQSPTRSPAQLPSESASAHLLALQNGDGSWEGEMAWNTMILSQQVILRHVVGRPLADDQRALALRHYESAQLADGSFGMHADSGGYVYFTTLAYIAMRMLGCDVKHAIAARALEWLRAHPQGILAIPSWGKYWLAFLGLYDYSGVNPCPPELSLLPSAIALNPSNYYCHTRNIYLGLAYLYGSRFIADLGALGSELRAELYAGQYSRIDFSAHRNDVAKSDLYVRPGRGLRASFAALSFYESALGTGILRRRALADCFDRILAEQRASRYQGLSPVNGILDTLAIFARDPSHPDLNPSIEGVDAWAWSDPTGGLRYAGARSQTWDTALAMQALLAHPARATSAVDALHRGYQYLASTQMISELPPSDNRNRDPILGGWCFSDGAHRWPVSDCTAEALSTILAVHAQPALAPAPSIRISDERLHLAAEFIVSRQNADGGFGTYERRRGGAFLEAANATEMYGACMTERSYIECTASSVAALAHFQSAYPDLASFHIGRALERGVQFLKLNQRSDGTWPGFWGVNFTYAIFHVTRALRAAGVPSHDPSLYRAAAWLVDVQKEDGGWGEHHESCRTGSYVPHPRSQPVMTSWALLSLLEILGPRAGSVERALAFLTRTQRGDGSYGHDAPAGVFFGSAVLDYRLYKDYFPAWALLRAEALQTSS